MDSTLCSSKSMNAAIHQRRDFLRAAAGALLLPTMAEHACFAASPEQAARAVSPSGTRLPLRVLLIGNATYQRNAVLTNPIRDTELLAGSFRARGADVQIASNLTAQQIEIAVRQFLQPAATRSSAIWLGYSGHAVQLGGRNYLQGVDSDFSTPQRVREHGMDLDLLLGLIERNKPSAAVVAIDACRNNPFEPERTRGISVGLAAQEPHGLCLSFSTAPYTKALDGDEGKYSPYAMALAQALNGPHSKSLDAVLRETANTVYRSTQQRQIPEYRSALRSEWWFDKNSVTLVAPTATAHAAVTGGSTRTTSYRPDEPMPHNRFQALTGQDWTQLDQKLQMALLRTGDAQVSQLVGAVMQGRGEEHHHLLAAMVLQDGHRAVNKHPAAARQLLLPLATQGHALAQTLLGESFYAARDYGQSYKWLSLAGRSNFPRATIDLGQLVAEGRTEGDPRAGALQILRGMAEHMQAAPSPYSTPSAEAMEQAEQIRKMLLGR